MKPTESIIAQLVLHLSEDKTANLYYHPQDGFILECEGLATWQMYYFGDWGTAYEDVKNKLREQDNLTIQSIEFELREARHVADTEARYYIDYLQSIEAAK